MSDRASTEFADSRTFAGVEVVRLPMLVRGELRQAVWPRVGEIGDAVRRPARGVHGPTPHEAYLLTRPRIPEAGRHDYRHSQVLVIPALGPTTLMEPRPATAVGELAAIPLDEVCAFVDAVGVALGAADTQLMLRMLAAGSSVADRQHVAFLDQVRGLFDGAAVRRMVRGALGDRAQAFERWVLVDDPPVSGITARMAGLGQHPNGGYAAQPALRAVPTLQLHITAGNAPVVLVTSLLWAWASKGACVVKPAAEAVPVAALLAAAIASVSAAHPLAQHTTIAYWRGGDRAVEDVLLADGAFDRRVVWGSSDATTSILARAPGTDTIVMRPRHAISLIGREAITADLDDTASRGAADSVVADQQACMSSLIHFVEGDEALADAYAEALARALAVWDVRLPHWLSDEVRGALVTLRRGVLATEAWRVNGGWDSPSSAVVRVDRSFDLRRHPGGRLVIVRAVPDLLSTAAEQAHPRVSHVGVAPASALVDVRDLLTAGGVDNVLPLGDAERTWAGRPHDGMNVLDRLVRWVNA